MSLGITANPWNWISAAVSRLVNSEVQIGQAAQLAATELADVINAVFEPPGISPPEEAVPTLSFALAGDRCAP